MEQGARNHAEYRREKAYQDRDSENREEAAKEDSDPSHREVIPETDESGTKPGANPNDPNDCLPKPNAPEPSGSSLPRRNCLQDEATHSPTPSPRSPSSPHYQHILPEHHPHWSRRDSGHAPPPPLHLPEPGQSWHHPPENGPRSSASDHESHANVRLPSIAALLTEPYSPQPLPRMAGYNERTEWLPPQPVPERYPPMVAALPLDDSRARTPQPAPQRKRGRLPKETTDFLKAWLHSHSAHPYPSEIEKKQMCHATGLSMSQVSNWMINGRRRILGPSYLSTSRPTPHSSPVTLSAPVILTSPSVTLSSPTLTLRSPTRGEAS